MKQLLAYVAVALDHLIAFFRISLPINIIFPLPVVYGIMGAGAPIPLRQ